MSARLVRRGMMRVLSLLSALTALTCATVALADPGDIDAAARGVVRVVIVETGDEGVFPVSHGSGFAVGPGRFVTNAHVVRDAEQDEDLRLAIVPPEGGGAVYGRVVAIDPQKDLALVATDGPLPLPPLALAGGAVQDSGDVAAVGYPMNVDRAQGLSIEDIFSAQPPVKSRGFLSGFRPSRMFDTVLHTAPIARGNSGGPLLDGCGRVLGVNSFGAEADGADGEFFFAVSARELIPFLRAYEVTPRINATPCRSLADLDAAERARIEAEQEKARAAMETRAGVQRTKQERARFEALAPDAAFTGYLAGEDLGRAYASADIFFNPSVTETFGNVTLEAMACALPCVVAAASGSRSLVAHERSGLLVPPDAGADAFAAALTRLAQAPSERAAFGAAARARAEDFDWDAILDGLIAEYQSIVASRPRH
mgnify:CR=1 FL=1